MNWAEVGATAIGVPVNTMEDPALGQISVCDEEGWTHVYRDLYRGFKVRCPGVLYLNDVEHPCASPFHQEA